MDDKFKSKGINGINKTIQTDDVKATDNVSSVDSVESVQNVSNVSGVNKVSGVRAKKITRIITAEEREKLFNMINEEADDIFGKNSKRGKVAKSAVKMALDSAIIKEE